VFKKLFIENIVANIYVERKEKKLIVIFTYTLNFVTEGLVFYSVLDQAFFWITSLGRVLHFQMLEREKCSF